MSDSICLHRNQNGRDTGHFFKEHATYQYCSDCGVLLWKADFYDYNEKVSFQAHDEVYELYYTKEGRRKLANEALRARGWPELRKTP